MFVMKEKRVSCAGISFHSVFAPRFVRRLSRQLPVGLIALCSLVTSLAAELTLSNTHLKVELIEKDGAWKLSRIGRADGSDSLKLHSDEFEIVLFDNSRFTVADYRNREAPTVAHSGDTQIVEIRYERKAEADPKGPESVRVTYTLGKNPWVHKTVRLTLNEGDRIDRLSMQRFSTDTKIRLGGRGQPLQIGNWWFGADYPCFYSRHTDGFANPDFYYRWDYMIDLKGRDVIHDPREHLATIFHFPGHARKLEDGSWGIASKEAVFGLSATKGENAELGLLDYITATRKPTRSYLHFNNWYSKEAKKLTRESFIEKTYRPMAAQLRKHGANLDGMVPDHGWEKTGSRIFEPQLNATHEPLPELQQILKEDGSGLGIWMALDGTNQRFADGLALGYEPAYGEGFDRSQFRWMDGNKVYYSLLQPKYFNDLKQSLRFLVADVGVDYIKHDFNHNFTSNHLSQRHAREACLDATLELLAYERELNPDVFINYTNGSWFSPFWLQHVDCLWMMTGDSGRAQRLAATLDPGRRNHLPLQVFLPEFQQPGTLSAADDSDRELHDPRDPALPPQTVHGLRGHPARLVQLRDDVHGPWDDAQGTLPGPRPAR